jgi:copper(I)-binding protein/uncharacterized protein YcnI
MIPLILAAGLAALSPMGVPAHATLDVSEAPAGASARIAVRIPHGCDGLATHTVEVTLPPALAGAAPMPKAGLRLTIEDNPAGAGGPLNRWSGGAQQEGWYDEFVFRGRVNAEPGEGLAWPVRQICHGGEVAWVEIAAPGQDPHDLPYPAPILRVAAPAGGGHHDHGAQMAQGHGAHGHGPAAGAAQLGALSVTGAYARANPAPGGASAAYMSIASAAGGDRLIAAESPVAARVELHTHTLDAQGVARMRQVEGIDVPAGGAAELAPGGLHVMLLGLAAPLTAGQDIPLTLRFEKAGAIELTVPVRDVRGGGHDHHGGHGG